MNILLSNDDGVHADGIKVLASELRKIARVFVVAPLEERSTTGHTLSLDVPLRVRKIEEDTFGCSGYPADCIMMAIGHLLFNETIDLVISGINRGANLGQDIYYSGTVAAAREACFQGHKSIAVSTVFSAGLYKEGQKKYYETAAQFVSKVVKSGVYSNLNNHELLNINVPNLPSSEIAGTEVTTLGFRKYSPDISERVDCRHRPYYWIGGLYKGNSDISGSDCLALDNNKISVTPINVLSQNTDIVSNWKNLFTEIKN